MEELTRRHLSETALLVEIRAVYAEARGAYGWPRVWRQLKACGVHSFQLSPSQPDREGETPIRQKSKTSSLMSDAF